MSFRITVGYNTKPTRKFQKRDALGSAVDLTGYVISITVKPFLSNEDGKLPDARAWIQSYAAELIEETLGRYQFVFGAQHTALPPGIWPAEIRFWAPPDAPETAPTDGLAGAGAGNVDNGLHSYKYTYVSPYGESDGSPVSDGVTVADKTVNGKVALTAVAVGPTGTTARKIYRTVAGDTGDYLLVATISDNSTTTYEDNVADASLGAALAAAADATATPEEREVGEFEVTEDVDIV